MIIAGLIIDTDAIKIISSSGIVGILLFLTIVIITIKIFWQKIKEKLALSIFCIILLSIPITLVSFIIPLVLDSCSIVEPTKEYKVEIVKKEFIKGVEGETTKIDKRGRKEIVSKYKIEDNYRLHLKKWYKSSDDKPLIAEVSKKEFDNCKENQLVYLKSYKGFLGFRHIVLDDKALKPVEESTKEKTDQPSK